MESEVNTLGAGTTGISYQQTQRNVQVNTPNNIWKPDIKRVATLYQQTRQKATIMFTTKNIKDDLQERLVKVNDLRTALATASGAETNATAIDKKRAAKLNAAIKKQEIMIEYLQLLEKQNIPEDQEHMVWIREPKVYALTTAGLQGVGFSSNDKKIALRGLYGKESAVGTTFKDLGLNEPVLLFFREFVGDKEVGGIFTADPSNPVGAIGAVGAVGAVGARDAVAAVGTVPGENASLLMKPLPAPTVDPTQVPVPGTYWASLGEGVKTDATSEVYFTQDQCVTTLGGEWRSFADWMSGRYEPFYDGEGRELGFCFKDGFSISYDAGPGNKEVSSTSEVSSEKENIENRMKLTNESVMAAAANFANADRFKEQGELDHALSSYSDAMSNYSNALEAYSALLTDIDVLEEPEKTTYKTDIDARIKNITETIESIQLRINGINQTDTVASTTSNPGNQAALLEKEGAALEEKADIAQQEAKERYTSYQVDPSKSSLTVQYIEDNLFRIPNEYNNATNKYKGAIEEYNKINTNSTIIQKISELQAKIDEINNTKIPRVTNSGNAILDFINGVSGTAGASGTSQTTNITDPNAEESIIEGGKLEVEADSLQAGAADLYVNLLKQSDGKQQIDTNVAVITGKYNSAKNFYQMAVDKYRQNANSASSEIQPAIRQRANELSDKINNIDSKINDVERTANSATSAAQAAQDAAAQAAANAAAQAAANAAANAAAAEQAAQQAAEQAAQQTAEQAAQQAAVQQSQESQPSPQVPLQQSQQSETETVTEAVTGASTGAVTGAVTGADTGASTGAVTGADTGTTIEVSPALRNKLDALGSTVHQAETYEQRGGESEKDADTSKAEIDSQYSGYRSNPPNYMYIQNIIPTIQNNISPLEGKYINAINNYTSAKELYTQLTTPTNNMQYTYIQNEPELLTYLNTKISILDTKIQSINNTITKINSDASSIIEYLRGIQTGGKRTSRKQRRK